MESGKFAAETAVAGVRQVRTARAASVRCRPTRSRMADEWGAYYRLGGIFVKLIGNPKVMQACTRHGLPHPALMRFVLKLLANLTDPQGRRRVRPGHRRPDQADAGGALGMPKPRNAGSPGLAWDSAVTYGSVQRWAHGSVQRIGTAPKGVTPSKCSRPTCPSCCCSCSRSWALRRFLRDDRAVHRPQALQQSQDGLLRVRHRADAATAGARSASRSSTS